MTGQATAMHPYLQGALLPKTQSLAPAAECSAACRRRSASCMGRDVSARSSQRNGDFAKARSALMLALRVQARPFST